MTYCNIHQKKKDSFKKSCLRKDWLDKLIMVYLEDSKWSCWCFVIMQPSLTMGCMNVPLMPPKGLKLTNKGQTMFNFFLRWLKMKDFQCSLLSKLKNLFTKITFMYFGVKFHILTCQKNKYSIHVVYIHKTTQKYIVQWGCVPKLKLTHLQYGLKDSTKKLQLYVEMMGTLYYAYVAYVLHRTIYYTPSHTWLYLHSYFRLFLW